MNKNIEKLIELRDDASKFNKLANIVIETAILEIAGGNQEKEKILRSIQWRYEQELRKLTGTNRLNKAVELFYEQLEKFKNALERI